MGIAAGAGATTELLDMKALEKKRNEEDDIAERMRVEETRAQLAAAKEGMAKEAERLQAEKEAKRAKVAAAEEFLRSQGIASGEKKRSKKEKKDKRDRKRGR